jgi:dTDP-4-dehydrorhamnose reductase
MTGLNYPAMKIAIVGAAGLIGKELAEYLALKNDVLALTRNDLNITDDQSVSRLIGNERPNLIINCAVLGVDACEGDPTLARATNVNGPESLARAAAEINAEIMHFSTNYIFDGLLKRGTSYSIDDLAKPISIYGTTKLAGELAVLANSQRAYIVRTSWVFGPGKSNFFSDVPGNLMAAKAVRAVTDVSASTTYVADLTNRIEQIIERQYYGTYHVVNSGVCSYYDFAQEAASILRLSATETGRLIHRATSAEMKWRASRPGYSPMRCILSERLGFTPMRDWRDALAEFIKSGTDL